MQFRGAISVPPPAASSWSYKRTKMFAVVGVGIGSSSSTRTVSYHCGLQVGSETLVWPANPCKVTTANGLARPSSSIEGRLRAW